MALSVITATDLFQGIARLFTERKVPNFIRLLSRRLAKVEMEFAGFGHTWSYHRLAKVLLELGAENGVKTPKGVALTLLLNAAGLRKLTWEADPPE